METLTGKHVVVTGGAGFAGSHLVDRLIDEGARKITILSNFSLGKRTNLFDAKSRFPITIEGLDVSGKEQVLDFFHDVSDVDVVFHLASIPLVKSVASPNQIIKEITDMTLNLCEAQRAGYFKTLIQYSSSEVYGTNIYPYPMNESHPTCPTTPYASAKLACDHFLRVYQKLYFLDAAIVRPFNFYGPRQNAGDFAALIPLVITKFMKGEPVSIHGNGEQTRDMTYISDVIDATIAAYKNPESRGHALNIGTGRSISIKYIVEKIASLMGDGKILYGSDRSYQVHDLCADINLAKQMIGYEPRVKFEDGIKETINWYLANHPG